METIAKNILQHANIQFCTITKATSGFTNLVFFADDKYVVKFSNDEQIKQKLNKEISIYKSIDLPFIPKYIASGAYQNFTYLIIKKLSGKSLYSIWHTLQNTERNSIISQIANILKQFNQIDCCFLEDCHKITNWPQYWETQPSVKKTILDNLGFDTSILAKTISVLDEVMSENQFGFVYNDAHFDNFIYDKTSVYLIDFDRALYCPIDYEMLIFKSMCDNPSKFASEEDEDNIVEEHYEHIYQSIQQLYPEMFAHKHYQKRIAVYQCNYMLKQAIATKNNKWIESELQKLNEFFK